MNCDEIKDLLLFYAGDAAEPDERLNVSAHLRTGCPLCAGRLLEAEQALAPLPLVLDRITPRPVVKERLMARIAASPRAGTANDAERRRSAPGRSESPGAATPSGDRSGREPATIPGRRSLADLWLRPALAAAIAAVIMGIVVYEPMSRQSLRLQQALTQQDARLSALRAEVDRASATIRMLRSPAVQVVSLAGSGPQPGASARIFYDRRLGAWQIYAADLKPAGAGKTYQLWAITADQKKVPAGIFDVNEAGEGELLIRLPAGIGTITHAAVTDEPAGGVPQPTGQIQLIGALPGSQT